MYSYTNYNLYTINQIHPKNACYNYEENHPGHRGPCYFCCQLQK